MKPIAQNFIISEPTSGVETVYITSVDLYFRSKSEIFGVEVQLRTTQNGVPTDYILPFGSTILHANSSNLVASSDSSIATKFTFDNPVVVKTNEQYSLVVSPLGGDPDYKLWTAKLGDKDLLTNSPIFKNNQIGSMFLGTNDINFTEIQDEILKYNIYVADFEENLTGEMVFTNSNTDYFVVGSLSGSFQPGEQVVMSNNELRRAVITVSNSTNFANGNLVYQPNTAANYLVADAYGTIVDVRGSNLVLKEVYGRFITTTGNTVLNANNSNTADVSGAYQNVVTSNNSTIVTVPDANTTTVPTFANGNYIYIATPNRSTIQVLRVASANAANSTVTLTSNVKFASSDAIVGAVKANADLYGFFSTRTVDEGGSLLVLDNVNANATQNFANSSGNFLIGMSSGATAVIYNIYDLYYDSITAQFSFVTPKDAETTWSFTGTSANSKLVDTTYIDVQSDVPYEFTDKKRVILSRSNEFANPVSNSSATPMTPGTKSLTIKATVSSANTKITPYVDVLKNTVVLTHNKVRTESALNGFYIGIANASNVFLPGSSVWQANSTTNAYARVLFSNNSTVVVSNVESDNTSHYAAFLANGTSIITVSGGSTTANVTAVRSFGEETDNALESSRYISKNVILAEGQDAEDIVTFLTAYRPPGTNFRVYSKLLSGDDSAPFDSKVWSYMPESSSPALISSLVNRDDFVELQYNLPTSEQKAPNNTTTSSNTTVVLPTYISTDDFRPGQFIYIADDTNKLFNVRQIAGIPDKTTLITTSNVSFTTANASIGLISDLTTQYSAFRYAANNNVMRYTTSSDAVFDSYKTFAVKILFLGEDSPVVPRLADMRTIALQV